MAQVSLNLNNITAQGLIADAKKYKTAMTGNAHFPDPKPTLANYGTLITTAENTLDACNVAQAAAQAATLAKDNAIQALHDGTITLGASVQSASEGDAAIIATADMAVKAAPTPTGPLPQVENLALAAGDNPGEVDAQWNPVKGKSVYVLQKCTGDPAVEANWAGLKNSSPSKTAVFGLTSGSRLWIRVRAEAADESNHGPWSQPATIIVP